MPLTTAQRDRTAGTLLATAAGDALGAPYEFGPPLAPDTVVAMTGGGSFGWAPGEWTDDTSMAVVIAELAAAGRDLRDPATQDALVARWRTGPRRPPTSASRPVRSSPCRRPRPRRSPPLRPSCTAAPDGPGATAR